MKSKFQISGLILIIFFTSCNDINSSTNQGTPCSEKDSIGVWKFLGLAEEEVISVAVHPQKPHVIFVGTARDFSAGTEGKLFISTDCGESWNMMLTGGSWRQIVFDPQNPKIIYAIPFQLIRSTNNGIHWIDISAGMKLNWETRVQAIAIDPIRPNILYAGTGGNFGGTLYKSTDRGESWYDLSPGDTLPLQDGVISLAIDPVNTDIIYAGTAWRGGLYKSMDGGESWIITGLGYTNHMLHDITIHPENHKIVFAGFFGFSRSSDGGDTWAPFSQGLPDSAQGMKLVIDPISYDYYSVVNRGISGGIYKRKANGSQWQNFGIEELTLGSYYTALTLTPDDSYLYFGPQEKGLFRKRLR